ncbi:MAG: hypothetical protein ACKO2B_07545, partial [Betaproteobacteria bacterium]
SRESVAGRPSRSCNPESSARWLRLMPRSGALLSGLQDRLGRPANDSRLRVIGRIRPREEEIAANPRARSAMLRVAERCGTALEPAR